MVDASKAGLINVVQIKGEEQMGVRMVCVRAPRIVRGLLRWLRGGRQRA